MLTRLTLMLSKLRRRRKPLDLHDSLACPDPDCFNGYHPLTGTGYDVGAIVWGLKPGQTDGHSLQAEWRAATERNIRRLNEMEESPEMPGPGHDAQTRRIQ